MMGTRNANTLAEGSLSHPTGRRHHTNNSLDGLGCGCGEKSCARRSTEPHVRIGSIRSETLVRRQRHSHEQVANRNQSQMLSLHRRSAPESTIAKLLVHDIDYHGFYHSFYALVPSYVGHSRVVDLAVTALTTLNCYFRQVPGVSMDTCRQSLAQALNALRSSMEDSKARLSDDIAISVAVLAATEGEINQRRAPDARHLSGLTAVLTSRPDSHEISDITRHLIYDHPGMTFMMPCIHGSASPFETQRWVNLDPPLRFKTMSSSASAYRLRKVAFQLFIRLPRLVKLVRAVRQAPNDTRSFRLALALAEELLALADGTAESELLHNVEVAKPLDDEDAKIMPVSFKYHNILEFIAGVRYWQARISLLRLRRRLLLNPPSQDATGIAETEQEMRRMAANLLMSWSFSNPKGYAWRFAILYGLVCLWGLTIDLDGFSGIQAPFLREWILQVFNMSRLATERISAREFDECAELLVGGPLEERTMKSGLLAIAT